MRENAAVVPVQSHVSTSYSASGKSTVVLEAILRIICTVSHSACMVLMVSYSYTLVSRNYIPHLYSVETIAGSYTKRLKV